MKTEWIDFKKVKEAVSMQMVLNHYGVTLLVRSGDELRGPCPIHKGSQRSKNFTVNTRKNAFKCFSSDCGARGNILDFVAATEQCSVRDAALRLQDWFKIGETETHSKENDAHGDNEFQISKGIYRDQSGILFEVVADAISAEDFEPLVVYRELFGDYKVWVGPREIFLADQDAEVSSPMQFKLVKAL